ncbi:hypothetical protein GUITHDRAFT_156633 [Guillardia theta CCMP2712]|uniref:Methionine aminopeptidase n=1 Tax=Guillardia theta (strain CCMP2712) TaxID=905079 RepID=L1I516_GUITC|nr:hypothetical protein GUITHDRAFT_156633 [Guillardia theta CCMP2712]EKX31306.1 hypothetical protein GUITHDRAFT_156633 [Guillardia theta CCMP2712]|eukprot:XP_005818286.1 hypothetical protein GUITHDRAFT_156633 [Guillardia theta CCMP2712]
MLVGVALVFLSNSWVHAFCSSGCGSILRAPESSMGRRHAARTRVEVGGGFGFARDSFKYTGTQRPSRLSPPRQIPDNIMKPDYAEDGTPKARQLGMPWDIPVNSPEDIEGVRAASRAAREVLDIAGAAVKPGMTTDEIDALVHEETIKRGCYPSPLNYNGFPKSVCTSINEVICHGIPCTNTRLKEGDIINIDVTCYLNGYHGDCSETFCVGEVDDAGKKLVKVTYDAWQAAIKICKPGVPYSQIGGVIDDIVTKEGFTSTRNFCGHGVGKIFHSNPTVLHYKNKQNNGVMAPGHIFTIEPMINEGGVQNMMWKDNWTATTRDGKRSAQFEHTLLITKDGVEALTAKTENSPRYWWEL